MSIISLLRSANARIEAQLARHVRDGGAGFDSTLQPEDFFELQRILDEMGPHLSDVSRARDEGTQPEIQRYTRNLEQLRAMLLASQEALVAQRAALRDKREGIQKALSWANSYKEML